MAPSFQKFFWNFLATLILFVIPSFSFSQICGADPCVSGPKIGERPGPYSFLVATGPQRGQQTCYVCETAEKPGVIVFARSLTSNLGKLLSKCDDVIGTRAKEDLRIWGTVLGEKTASLDSLSKWAKEAGLKRIPVGVFDDPVGPPTYRLAEDADVTVLLFVDRKVVGNYAIRTGELTDGLVKRIVEDVSRLSSKK